MKCAVVVVLLGSLLSWAGDKSPCDLQFSTDVNAIPQKVPHTMEHYSGGGVNGFEPFGRMEYSGQYGVPCRVSVSAQANQYATDTGTISKTGWKHSGAGNFTLGSASGIAPQSATTNYVGGFVSCFGGCGDETVTGGPPWTIVPGPWLVSTQGLWTLNAPAAKASRNKNCSRRYGKVEPKQCENGDNCQCNQGSPIVIDTNGKGFDVSGWANADIGDGVIRKYRWPKAGSGNGFLVYDRNGNGKVDPEDYFGNFTEQQDSKMANGCIATEAFDLPENGGNLNNRIDPGDKAWKHAVKLPFTKPVKDQSHGMVRPGLQIWIPEGDAVSKPRQFHSLEEFGIEYLSTECIESVRRDRYGNQLRYLMIVKFKGQKETLNRAADFFLKAKEGD